MEMAIERMKKRNKKGYIRTIEAILAILVVFAFVVTILPKKTTEIAKAPPELDSTMKSILEEAQNNEEFRTCLLLNNNVKLKTDSTMKTNAECLKDQLDKALPAFSPWDYGFAICYGALTDKCAMFNSTTDETGGIIKLILPQGKAIYTKSSVIAVPDVMAKPFLVTGCCNGASSPPATCELNEKLSAINMPTQNCIPKDPMTNKLLGKTIYLYLWDKQ